MVDLKASYPEIRGQIDEAIKAVLDKTNFILGEEVAKLSKVLRLIAASKYAVGVASGTDALIIALLACGVKKGMK